MPDTSPVALVVEGVAAWYGGARVLHGVDLTAPAGQVTAVLGRNGAGKTTLARCVAGVHRGTTGAVRLGDRALDGLPSWARARAGLGYVPQGRRVFASLTTRENLEVAARGSRWTTADVLDWFPRLGERLDVRAGALSGGEQQMLAMARALRTGPRVLLLDEPSEGLAPQIVASMADLVLRLVAEGLTVVLFEQNLKLALDVASHVAVVDRGVTAHEGDAREFGTLTEVHASHLGV